MEELTEINESKLAKYLQLWFKTADLSKRNFWHINPVGSVIKDNLSYDGRWRNRRRGNPRKGYIKQQESSNKQQL